MKRVLVSLGLFFAVQILAAIAATLFMLGTGKDITADSDTFAVATGVVLLVGNTLLAAALTVRMVRADSGVRRERRSSCMTRNSFIAIIALLLLALGETLALSPLNLEDMETERLFKLMVASPLCLLNLCVAGPVVEELVFRWGVLGGLLQRGTKTWVAILASALCFAAVHGNWMQAVPALLSGALLGLLYIRSRSLVPCIVAHIVNNTVAVVSMSHPATEDTLTAQPTPLLVTEGLVLAAVSVFAALKIKAI